MCGCSSNFDGTSGVEEMEKRVYLDFDGEDDDFDGFLPQLKDKKLLRNAEKVKLILFSSKNKIQAINNRPDNYTIVEWMNIINKFFLWKDRGFNNEESFKKTFQNYDKLLDKVKSKLEAEQGTKLTNKEALELIKQQDAGSEVKSDTKPKVDSSSEIKSKPKSDAIKDDVEVKGAVDTTDADENKKADDIRVKNINENFFLRNKTPLMIGGGVLLALGIGFIVYRKLKK